MAMPVMKKYYKNSTQGYLICCIWNSIFGNSEVYFKNGMSCEKEELNGCVEISEKRYNRELRKIKKQALIVK